MLDYRSESFNHVFFYTEKKAGTFSLVSTISFKSAFQRYRWGEAAIMAMIATKTMIISTTKMTNQLKLNMCVFVLVTLPHLTISAAFFLLGVQTWNLALSASRFFFNSLKPAIWDQDTTQLSCIFREVEVWHPHKTMLELMKQYSVLTEYHSFAATTLANQQEMWNQQIIQCANSTQFCRKQTIYNCHRNRFSSSPKSPKKWHLYWLHPSGLWRSGERYGWKKKNPMDLVLVKKVLAYHTFF